MLVSVGVNLTQLHSLDFDLPLKVKQFLGGTNGYRAVKAAFYCKHQAGRDLLYNVFLGT